MVKIEKLRGRKRKYSEYEELLLSVKGKTLSRPVYKNGIGLLSGKRGITVYIKIRIPHGMVYKGKSIKPNKYIEMKVGNISSFTWEQVDDLFRFYQGKADRNEAFEEKETPTFSEYIETYLARSNMVPMGIINTRLSVEKNLRPTFGAKYLKDITPQDIDLWQSKLLTTKKPSSVLREKVILKATLNMAVSDGLIEHNPCDRSRSFKVPERRPRFMTRSEIATFLKTATEIKDWLPDFIMWALNSGMRRGEILSLEWKNIIQKPNGNHFVEFRSGKTQKIRTVPCTQEMTFILERQLKRVGSTAKNVFPYSLITLNRAWKSLRDQTGIDDIRIHDLRVTFASYGASAGIPPKTLATLMGHSSLKMIEKHYVGVSEADTILATSSIQKLFLTTKIEED